jgi:uncharacterized protein (TIGR03435 family)
MMVRALAAAGLLGVSGLAAGAMVPTASPQMAFTQNLGIKSAKPRPKFDAFDVATIKPVESDKKTGSYIKMDGDHRYIEKDHTLKMMIAAAYNLNPRMISGGPAWMESDHYDIVAVTPGEVRPDRAEQMTMLRALLADRFQLTFHREPKEFSIYELEQAKSGSKLKPSALPADAPPAVITTVYSDKLVMPARNVSMDDFTAVLQRAVLDRPVVDKTGLTGRYDFDLEWAPDETQFGGDVGKASDEANATPFFKAVQEQLGLHLKATRGTVQALVVDKAEKPSEN